MSNAERDTAERDTELEIPCRSSGAAVTMDFMAHDYNALTAEGFSPRDIEDLPVPELVERITGWVAGNK